MRRTAILISFVLALAGAVQAAATTAFDPLAGAVAARRAGLDLETRRGRREDRKLARLADTIDDASVTVGDDLALAARAGKLIRADFRRDAELPGLFAAAENDLAAAANAERVALGLWTDRVGDAAGSLARADAEFARALRHAIGAARAKFLSRACRELEATRSELGLVGDPPPLPPQVMPDFSIADVNPVTPTYGKNVSPRDYLGKFSAWYFGHAG